MIWSKNIFNTSGEYATPWACFAIKNALFSDNIVQGDSPDIWLYFTGINWVEGIDVSSTEACRILNNKILSTDVHFYLDILSNDNILMGDLTNLIVEDNGVNNNIIGKTNPNHAGAKYPPNLMNMIEKLRNRAQR